MSILSQAIATNRRKASIGRQEDTSQEKRTETVRPSKTAGSNAHTATGGDARSATGRQSLLSQAIDTNRRGGVVRPKFWQDNDFNSWLGDVESFSRRMSSDYAKRQSVYQPVDTFRAYQDSAGAEIDDLLNRAYSSRDYFSQYGDIYDKLNGTGSAEKLLGGVRQNIDYLEDVRKGLQDEGKWWEQFQDQDAFDAYQRQKAYADLTQAADFAEKSRYQSTYKEGTEKFNAWSGTHTDTGFGDINYDYINRNEKARERQLLANIQNNTALLGLDNSERGEMTDEEIAIFNYLYATKSPEEAYQYVTDLTSELNFRQRQSEEAEWGKYASENPVGASAFSILQSPLKGLSYLGQAADYLADGEIDQNEGYNKFSYIPSAIRGQVSQDIERNVEGFWGKAGSFAYQTGMSMGDFLLNTGITGGNQALTLAIMGTGAAADSTISAKDRGLSDDKAFALGTIAGLAEVVTEKVSLETLLKPDWEKGVLNYVIKNAVAEGSEEVASDAINLMSDVLISKDKSEWAQSIQTYMDQGYTEAEAMGLAARDQALNMGVDFLGGAISGGIMSGVAGAGQVANNYQSGRQLNAMELSAEDIQAFIGEGLESDPSTQAYKLAVEAQKKLDGGGTLTDYELGNLYQANVRAVGMEDEGAELLEQAARETAEGRRITNRQAAAILDNPGAMRTLSEEAGLTLSDDMSKSQQREAVRTAISALARPAVATETSGATNITAETERPAMSMETGTEQSAAQTAARTPAEQVWLKKLMNNALDTLGEQGKAQGMAFYDDTQDPVSYYGGFATYYEAGVNGTDMGKVQGKYAGALNSAQRQAAYLAGQADAAASLRSEQGRVPTATVYGKEAGFIQSDLSASLPKRTVAYLNDLGRAAGVKIQMAPATGSGGANGWYANGIVNIAADAEAPGMVVATHEITHRMQEMAPTEYRAYRDYAMKLMDRKAGIHSTVEDYKARYAQAGQNLTTEQAMDEIAADFTGDLLRDVEGFKDLARENRSVARKLLDAVRDFIRKVKRFFKGNKAAQDSAAVNEYGLSMGELERAAKLWGEALEATTAQARVQQNTAEQQQDGGARMSLKEAREAYAGTSLTEDGEVYSYDFLTSLPDMRVTALPDVDAVRGGDRRVDTRAVVTLGMKNARAVGTERDGKVFVRNSYTGGQLLITSDSIRHGLNGGLNRLLTNSRLGAVIGDVVKNAVPINSLQNKAEGVTGTYAMAGYATDSQGREFVAIVTVEQYDGNVAGIEVYDVTHAVSGRQKNSSQASTKLQGFYPIKAAEISIADFLEVVNTTHQSILSDDVLAHFGETRNENGDYAGKVRFSLKKDSDGRALTTEQQAYFRDSKITDKDGKLLVLYHGTTAYGEITKFRRGRSGWLGPGIYLSSQQADARRYANAMGAGNGQLYELYANVTNPLVVTQSNPVPEILRAAYGRDSVYTVRSAKQGNDARIITPADIKKLQGKGYDGIRWDFGAGTEVSVFSPEQIKRVDNKAPTGSQDVRYSLKYGGTPYNRTAILNEDTVDRYLADYAAKSTPNYAQAYIAKMMPDAFLALTTSPSGRQYIEEQSRELNAEELGETSRRQPIQLRIDHKTGEVLGHEGRHRAQAMLNAGIDEIPVLLFDSSNKYDKQVMRALRLTGQDFGGSRSYAKEYAHDVIPLSYANRDAIIKQYATQKLGDRRREQDGSAQTLRFSLKAPVDSQGRELTDAQRDFFRDSKVVDSDGRLKVVYHGSPSDFNQFSLDFLGTNGTAEGYGFYFTDKKEIAEGYSHGTEAQRHQGVDGRLFEVYLDIKKPLSDKSVTMKRSDFKKFLLEMNKQVDEDGEPLDFLANYGDVSYEGLNAVLNEAMRVEYDGSDSDVNMIHSIINGSGSMETVFDVLRKTTGYDGIIVDNPTWGGDQTIYVVFHSDQIKNVGNKNPTSNPDIRYSLKQTRTIQEELAAMRQQNRKLQERLDEYKEIAQEARRQRERADYWKGQTRRTERVTTDAKAVAKAARELIRDTYSTADLNGIQAGLQDLYDYIANGTDGKNDLTYTEARRRAEAIAWELVESAVTVDDDGYQQYSDLRDYLRTANIIYGKEYHGDIPDFNDFRRSLLGRLNLRTNGRTNIDGVYMELEERWPEFFNSQWESHPTAQLTHIAEVLNTVYGVNEYNPFSQEMENAVADTANEIMERFFDLPQTRATMADRYEAKLDRAVAHGKQQVQKAREQNNARIERLREQNRERVERAIKRERQIRQRQVDALKDRYAARDAAGRERRSAAELRRKITRHSKALSDKLLHPTDKKHIPEELRGAVAAMLEAVNQESQYTIDPATGKRAKNQEGDPVRRTEAFRALREQYEAVNRGRTDFTGVLDPDLLDNLAEVIAMRDVPIADMTTAQLSTVWQVVRAVEQSVSTANKLLGRSRFESVAELANGIRSSSASKRAKGNWRGPVGWADRLLNLDMMNPMTFFHQFGEGGDALYHELQEARDQKTRILAETTDQVQQVIGKTDINKLREEAHTFQVEGGELTMTTAQIMSLYELAKREQAQDHIYKGGLRASPIDTSVGKGKSGLENVAAALGKVDAPAAGVRVTLEDVADILSTLTDRQVEIADGLQGIMQNYLAREGNRESMKVYGYEKFTEDHYFPISSDPHQIQDKIGDVLESGEKRPRSIAEWGSAKATVANANNGLLLGDIFDVFAQHAVDMATYASHLGAMEDMNRVRNFTFRGAEGERTGTMGDIIQRVAGQGGGAYLNKLLQDVSAGTAKGSVTGLGKLTANYKAASVGANIRVALQQPTSYLRAAAVISPKYLADPRVLQKGGWVKALKYAPIAVWKDWGNFEINQGRQLQNVMFNTDSKLEKARNAAMWLAGEMDSVTWGRIWNACELEVMDTQPGLARGSEAFYSAVAQRFTDVVDQTQVVDNVLGRSQIMRSSDGLAKMATSYMGEPTQSYNLVYRAVRDIAQEQDKAKRTAARKVLGRSIAALAASQYVNAIAQALWDAVRDDDDRDKKYWERVLGHIPGNFADNINPVGMVPYLKDVFSVLQGYDVKRMDMEAITSFISACQNMGKAINGEGRYTLAGAGANLAAETARIFGLPAATVKRDLVAIARTVGVETGDWYFQYQMEKALNSVGYSGNRGEFYDIAWGALRDGEMDVYQTISQDLMAQGIKASTIESAMRERLKKAQGEDPSFALDQQARDLIGSRDSFGAGTKETEPGGFTAADLAPAAYQDFNTSRAADYRRVVDDLEGFPTFGALDGETKDKALATADTLTEKLALEAASDGAYTVDTKWMLWAAGGEDAGVSEAEAILFKAAYDMTSGDVDENGKTISGSKKENVLEAATDMMPWLTDEELAYLMSNYWKG